MGDAAKVIDWNGTDAPVGLGELLEGLPPGRYRLAVVPEEGSGVLTPEGEAEIEAARQSLREGRGLSLEEVDARMRARIAAASVR
jgi:hypothetical protein